MINVKEKLSFLPDKPGCYLMKDKYNEVIYVGKAKNLKNRVRSYFVGTHNAKTTKMVSLINDFEYIITTNETEALILEMNLIKEHDPKYNILLTDDKTYPYIKLSNHKHPILEVTRKVKKGTGKYYGPYPNVGSAREVVKLLNSIYPLRKCKTIPKVECIYLSMNQCLGPCIKTITKEDYKDYLYNINNFLSGNTKEVVKQLQSSMIDYAEKLMFEKAAEVKKLIDHITNIETKQKITINDYIERDIFGFFVRDNKISVEIFYMRQGKIIANHRKIFTFVGDEKNVINEYIFKYYQNKPIPKEILTTQASEDLSEILNTRVTIPKIGDKKKIVDLAISNAKEQLIKNVEILNLQEGRTLTANNELGKILNIPSLSRIECFDNSNIAGSFMVSAMVVFIDGKPSRKNYRKYKIKTLEQQDDYGSMREVVYRRYRKALMENTPLPDLILVDGGKGQISVTKEILDSLGLTIPLCGLKKNKLHKTDTLLTSDFKEIQLEKRSNVFNLLTRIQDETHRYAITFHRQVRGKSMVGSILDNIDGVGSVTRDLLLKEFNDIYEIKKQTIEAIVSKGVNKKVVEKVLNYLNKEID